MPSRPGDAVGDTTSWYAAHGAGARTSSPYMLRMRLLWERMRGAVVPLFPPEPGRPVDRDGYLTLVEELYRTDAYHSLSIEGYRVTEALIQRVATGLWNPGEHGSDADARNASGTGHDARVLRLTGTRATGIGEGGPGALHVCLHSSVHGRQWSHGDIAPFASFVASCMRDY